MTTRSASTVTCDACGRTRTVVEARFSVRIPDHWAEIALDYRDAAADKQVYEEWHLCPDCTGELVLAIVKHPRKDA
jgi:hypothetical protein